MWQPSLILARFILQPLTRCFPFFVPVFLAFGAPAHAPRLELSRSAPAGTILLRLTGETNRGYVVEVSTNLTSWQRLTELQTTNGAATLTYFSSESHQSFLRARTARLPVSVTPQIASDVEISTFISAEGGELELVTPDLRAITLAIPPGGLVRPTEVRLSLVTNLVGLPFAQGTVGTVRIEPESLMLLGAATLTIECPAGLDPRNLVSFTANNDGTGFRLALDRVLSNSIVVPLSDFAMYGSAIATLPELEAFAPGHPPESQVSPQGFKAFSTDPIQAEICRLKHPDEFRVNSSQFPQSSSECFGPQVARAIAVQDDLRAFLLCDIMEDLAVLLAYDRSHQLLGFPSKSGLILSNYVKKICPIYQERVEPLWAEAIDNCALSIVLMQFMLGFERQLQIAGLTDLTDCNYTLFGNLDKVCQAAEQCIQETKFCCVAGHRGQEKYLEISNILKQFELVGETSCFPTGMDDPRVQEALDLCLTNAWYGSFQVRHYGNFTKVQYVGSAVLSEKAETDVKFDGGVFESMEQPALPGFGKMINLQTLGTGVATIDSIHTALQRTNCRDGGTAEVRSYSRTYTTGSFTGTNGTQVIWGTYNIGIAIREDNTYQISAGGPLLMTKTKTESFGSSTTCEGKSTNDPREPYETTTGALFPIMFPTIKPMNTDTNVIKGTHRQIDDSGAHPVTTEFSWEFKRVVNR